MTIRFISRRAVAAAVLAAACGRDPAPAPTREHAPGSVTEPAPAASIAAPDSATLVYLTGREALDRGDTTIAMHRFDETMRWPMSGAAPHAMYWKAFVLYRRGDAEDLRVARNLLELATQLAPASYPTGDASMLRLHVEAALSGGCSEARARFASAVAPGLDRNTQVYQLVALLGGEVPCGPLLREQALLMLGRIGSPSSIAAILRSAEHDAAPSVRHAALRVLPSPAPDVSQPVLLRILQRSRDASALEFAGSAWYSRRGDWGTAALREFLARPDRNATAASHITRLLDRP